MRRSLYILVAMFLTVGSARAVAGVEQLCEADFRALAAELSHKVNLFHDIWEKDPAAAFYGGTTRDFLFWLKGKFRRALTAADANAVRETLRQRSFIDVREFIIGDSDVDVFSPALVQVKPEDYGVRKIDLLPVAMLDPKTDFGFNEFNQGYVPVEKIRMGLSGFVENPALGNGLHEIYVGHPTVHFSDPLIFARTKYAQAGENHPVLLAIRYLRVLAIEYFQTYGQGRPNAALLLSRLDAESAVATRAAIASALEPQALKPFLLNHRFKSWLNSGIQKAFRSYTNPTAAKILLQEFRVDELPLIYPKDVQTIYQYVFAIFRDPVRIRENLRAYNVDEGAFFRSVAEYFPDGFLYHGTKDEKRFRSIIFQGVLDSESGSGGAGLYGVAVAQQKFAEMHGGQARNLLRFPVKASARIVDITRGEGARVWAAWIETHGDKTFDDFSEAFGVDGLRYPIAFEAFTFKNSEALGKAEGVHRKILSIADLEAVARETSDPVELSDLILINQLTTREAHAVMQLSRFKDRALLAALIYGPEYKFMNMFDNLPPEQFAELGTPEVINVMRRRDVFHPERNYRSFIRKVLFNPEWKSNPKFMEFFLGSPYLRAPKSDRDSFTSSTPTNDIMGYFSLPHSVGDRKFFKELLAQPGYDRDKAMALMSATWRADKDLWKWFVAHGEGRGGTLVHQVWDAPAELQLEVAYYMLDDFPADLKMRGTIIHMLTWEKSVISPELVARLVAERCPPYYEETLARLLARKEYANHPELLRTALRAQEMAPHLWRMVLSKPWYRARPEYGEFLKLVGEGMHLARGEKCGIFLQKIRTRLDFSRPNL